MGREDSIEKAVETWRELDVERILIVDFNCKKSEKLVEIGSRKENKRIDIVRPKEHDYPWILSWAYNIGFKSVETEYILKLDADDMANKEEMNHFINEKKISMRNTKCFFTGDWKKESTDKYPTSSGVFFAMSKLIQEVGGFNPIIMTWMGRYRSYYRYSKLVEQHYIESG